MTEDIKKAYRTDNLKRAWVWINSNSNYQYKNYFRDLYKAYSYSIDDNLKDLQKRLKKGTYRPVKPVKVYLPKKSGILRPITLLSIEDQIVYQALVNVIAEEHMKKTKTSNYVINFGNIYAGKGNPFFYKRWQTGYKKYTEMIKHSFQNGYIYAASFDLTAFYDSIDYKVLEYFLSQYNLDKEFIQFLIWLLSYWTTDGKIIQGVGIPQGPIGSGLLSEVIVSFFDNKFKENKFEKNTLYIRYVDDIRLMAKDETSLRLDLVRLDYYSKKIGLYPQSSKIDIHEIISIDDEVKNLSQPFMDIKDIKGNIDNVKANEKLLEITRAKKVEDTTKFKIYLSNAKPNYKLTDRIINLLESNPDLYDSICSYFMRYPKNIPNKPFGRLLDLLKRSEIYQVISGKILFSVIDNLSEDNFNQLYEFIKSRWLKGNIKDPLYKATIIKSLLANNYFKYDDIKALFKGDLDWWTLKTVIKYINYDYLGEPSYKELLKLLLTHESVDVSISAANELIQKDVVFDSSLYNSNHIAQQTLKSAGVIKRAASAPSEITYYLNKICKYTFPEKKWKIFFGEYHEYAENKVARAYGYSQNDISAFVNIIDVFNDFLLDKLFIHDNELGRYQLGNIGSVIQSEPSKFNIKYPKLRCLCKAIHDKRLQCDLSHPKIKNGGYTKPIKFNEIKNLRRLMREGYLELINLSPKL